MPQAITLSPAEQAEYEQLATKQPAAGASFNPFTDLSAEELADLSIKDKDNFDLVTQFQQNKPLWKDQSVVQKTADALDIIEKRGFELADIPGPRKIAGAVKDVAVGLGKNAWNIVSGTVTAPFSFVGEKLDQLAGVKPEESLARKDRQEAQRKIAESFAGTEAAVTGLQQQVVRGGKKLSRAVGATEGPITPEDRVKNLWGKVGEAQTIEQATAGKGPFMQAVGGETIKSLEEAGKPIRPEQVAELSAGDPFTFYTFGKVFHGAGKLVPAPVRAAGAAVAEKAGEIAASAGGKAAQAAGTITELGARAVGKTAKVVAPAAGLVTGLVKGGPVGALAGLKGGEIAGRAISKGAAVVERAGAKVAGLGEQVSGAAPVVAPIAQVGRDILQSAPGAAGEIAKGLGLDIGLAAATAETPQETEAGIGIGAAFGALGAARRTAGRVVSGQIIAPRAWGSQTPVPSSGQFPALDAAHSAAVQTAPPGIRERLNAVRQFVAGAAPGTDVFLAKDDAGMEKALTDSGMSPADAKLFSQQEGFFTAELPGKDGTPRRVIGMVNVDAAPHESFHAFQDVLGESANRAIDDIVRRDYGDRWEHEAQRYAARLGNTEPANWRAFLLDNTGWGKAAALEKLSLEMANQISAATGAAADPAAVKDLVAGAWNEAKMGTKAGPENEKQAWRGILDEAEATDVSDRYIAREIAAENFDAVFKNLGASLQEQKGIIPKLARIVANTVSLVGGEPLAGRASEVGNIPLRAETVEAVKSAAQGKVPPVVEPAAAAPRVKPIVGGIPQTPEQQLQAAEEARTIAAEAPDVTPPGGLKSMRELLGAVAEAIAQRVGIKLNYLSAKDEPAASISSNRKARREMIEAFRSMPQAARALWEKNFFPERILRTSGGVLQVLGWAPEVFAANAHKLAGKLPQNFSPYEIDPKTKTFTPEAWQELYEDTQKFVQNQMGGRTGAGEPLVVPGNVEQAGFFKPPQTGEAAGIDQRKADFISLLFGVPLPKTPRITKGKLPLNIAGQEVSAATKPGRVSPTVEPRAPFAGEAAEKLGIAGRIIQEVNPLRAEIENAGVKMPELIEAIQRLNAENIREVDLAPEQPQFRGNTLTLSAGFQPMPENPRAIREAAVKDKEGNVYTGRFHGDAFAKAEAAGSATDFGDFDTGFVTNSGEYLNREAAYDRARQLNQMSAEGVKTFEKGIPEAGFPPTRSLESTIFDEARQFQPARERLQMETTGPDEKKYKVTFDGYQDFSPIGRGMEPQFTALEDIPGVTVKGSTLYKKTLEDNGYKAPADLPAPEQMEPAGVQFQPNAEVQKVADEYAGRELPHGVKPPTVNTATARKLADFYETAKHAPDDEAVKASYDALRDETLKQLDAIEAAGYTIEPWTGKGEPYKNSAEMTADVQDNKHLWFNPTDKSFTPAEGADNLMLAPSGVNEWGYDAPINDVFRAVHDFFGHAAEGYQFGPRGELAAWNAHSEMYSPEAQPALAAETLAQNSWVNFGKHLEGKNLPLTERPFAEQKNIVVPAELISEAKAQFSPKSDEYKFQKSKSGFSKAWILPNGKPVQLGGQWHHEWVNENPDIAKKYGLKTTESGEENRNDALKAGFARINLDNRSGQLTIEARAKDWRKLKPSITDLIDKNLDDIDRMSVFLMNEDVTKVADSAGESLFNYDTDAEKMQNLPFITKGEDIRGQFQPKVKPDAEEAFQKANNALRNLIDEKDRAVRFGFPQAELDRLDKKISKASAAEDSARQEYEAGGQFQPRAEQEQLFGGRELLSTTEIAGMSRADLRKHFPEAIVPARLDEQLPSRITESPLYKTADDPVSAFADKLVEFARGYESDPLYQAGARWYSEFTPMLKKEFGADAPVMAELLAATSPQTNPTVNFGYALDALEGLKSGRFKKIIDKFNQGLKMVADGKWEKSAPTPARFMAEWIDKHDLKPKQSNGKLYGQHSLPVLQVFARRWLSDNRGPKTRNFVENLLGISDEATIDLWADRTMRRIGYADKERWRILPQNGAAVSDADFAFAQKAFRAAADELGMKPSALQGALWFAEKSLYGRNGWSRLDLGDYRKEISKAGLLRTGIKQREAATKAREKTGRVENIELPLIEPRNVK